MEKKKNDNEVQGPSAPEEGQEPPGNHARGDYAAHLARVTPNAEFNKALLLARYRALRDGDY